MEFGFLEKKRRVEKRGIPEESESSLSSLHVPQEVIDSILTRLPLKSLVRFESVCKAWCSSISAPDFPRRDRPSVLVISESSEEQIYYLIREQEKPSVVSFPVIWNERSLKSMKYPETKKYTSKTRVSNSCNGMVLVCVGTSFFLFNPSINYSVKVLTLNYFDDGTGYDSSSASYEMYVGLYYDETISDYMAVVLIRHTYVRTTVLVEASLKGKRWNYLNHTFNLSRMITVGPVFNGQLHWLNHTKIIRFDPGLKVFEELPSFQPHQNHTEDYGILGVGILEGCLCVSRILHTFNIEILAMKIYGVSESWTPIYSFPANYFCRCNPLLLTRAGELLVSTYGKIWVHDLGKKSFKEYCKRHKGRSTCSVLFVQNMDTPIGYYWNHTEHEKFGNTEDFERLDEFREEVAFATSRELW